MHPDSTPPIQNDDNVQYARPEPPTESLEAITEFWETHSLADYWDQTEPAEFEFDSEARRFLK